MGLKKLLDSGYKEMKRCEKLAYKIEGLEESVSKLSDEELKHKTVEFKEASAAGGEDHRKKGPLCQDGAVP